ncbi:MAG: SDR family NAD(P)-dependent oxidoreductase [Thermoproteota archaeon]
MELKPIQELLSLKGKRAMITGSASGIGRCIAYRFAEAGADLEVVDLNEAGLKQLVNDLSKFQVEVNAHRVDLSKEEEVDLLWSGLKDKMPDILVNNAGVYPFKKFLSVDRRFLENALNVNLTSVFWMCQHMIRRRARRGGVIINVGSIEAILPFQGDMVHYDVSKAGVIALTRALAKEYGKRGFRVNAIIPGGIKTPGVMKASKNIIRLHFGLIKSWVQFKWRLPLGRLGHPDEVARMALVLASDLSSYVQGALIVVDGGFLSA